MHVQKNPSGTLGTSITKSRCPLPIQGISLRKAIKMISANKRPSLIILLKVKNLWCTIITFPKLEESPRETRVHEMLQKCVTT